MLIRKAVGKILHFFWNSHIFCWLLSPFVPLFVLARTCRILLSQWTYKPLGVPTCIVGNLRVGGTGKTPFVLWLAQALKEKGYSVGVVSYPYMAPKQSKTPVVSVGTYDYEVLGDEAALIGTLTQCPVAVGLSRSAAALALIQDSRVKLDFMIFDDGLQCPSLRPDITIALFQKDHGNGYTIPMGPLRAQWESLEQIDFLLRVSHVHDISSAIVKKNVDYAIHHHTKEKRYLTDWERVSVILAIAYPQALIDHLKEYIIDIDLYLFEDHQPLDKEFYQPLCRVDDLIVTQKEWIKMVNFLSPSDRVWIIPLEINIDKNIQNQILSRFEKEYSEHFQAS
jgi:tetraacyldisaccharide 4'-kinase